MLENLDTSNTELVAVALITHAGDARSTAFEALTLAKSGSFIEAKTKLVEASHKLAQAHKVQTTLLQEEARGKKNELNLLLVHAQDHLMNAVLAKDLITELIELYITKK